MTEDKPIDRSIHIESPGLLTTVQDLGRFGYQRYGMPVAGAVDGFSLQLANLLVGNDRGMAALEATLAGPEVRFDSAVMVAVCGGAMTPLLNGVALPAHKSFEARPGDLLTFKAIPSGCRAYIAFEGGIALDPVMGSRATYLAAAVGGFQGRPLRKGDTIPLGDKRRTVSRKAVPTGLLPQLEEPVPVRIMPGPESSRMTFEGLKNLINSEYEVGPDSNRMGLRLQGAPVSLGGPGHQIISSGVVAGTIQVPDNGQPILLLADRQTTGGYARVAVVAAIDHSILAQLLPGDSVSFSEIGHQQAVNLMLARQQKLADFAAVIQNSST